MSSPLRVLALEPYYGGSHRAFLDGWRRHSRHAFDGLHLPPHHWKWRMRHAAVTFADEVCARWRRGDRWDVVFASSMLDLATFRGLAPNVATLPTVVYFHENQLTYPQRHDDPRDLHFAVTHVTTGLAADAIWFASAYHRDDFLAALRRMVARLPESHFAGVPERLEAKTAILPQGIETMPERTGPRPPGPLRLVWAARWEHDKAPETFFAALDRLAVDFRVDFRVDVLGESFRTVPDVFDRARRRHAARIGRWGHVPRAEYLRALAEADVFVSTARHEFFGVAAAEACAAGCFPLLPARLAYPELLAAVPAERREDFFFARAENDGGAEVEADELAGRLAELAARLAHGGRDGLWRAGRWRAGRWRAGRWGDGRWGDGRWRGAPGDVRAAVAGRFRWPVVAGGLDAALADRTGP